jgi:hypothetical protein
MPIFGGAACCAFDHGYYIGFYNNTSTPYSHDEFDLYIGNAIADPALGIQMPFVQSAVLYGCQSTACTKGFIGDVSSGGISQGVTAEFTATRLPVPEPATLQLILMGMLALGLLGAASRKFS